MNPGFTLYSLAVSVSFVGFSDPKVWRSSKPSFKTKFLSFFFIY